MKGMPLSFSLPLSALRDDDGRAECSRRPDLDAVAFLLCLEPSATPNPTTPPVERALNAVVEGCSPAPAILHVELLFPPDGRDAHFSTYVGARAGWGRSFGSSNTFYTTAHAGCWRAVPVVAERAAERVRTECDRHVNTTYSLLRYMFATPPLRALASLLPDAVGSPAHCATLCARVMRRALPELRLLRPTGWYSPSTLLIELDSEARRSEARMRFERGTQGIRGLGEVEAEAGALGTLLRGSDEEVQALDAGDCTLALASLTRRALSDGLDDVARTICQKQLATALLRRSCCSSST